MSWLIGHNIDNDTELTPIQRQRKLYIIRAEEAIHREVTRQREIRQEIQAIIEREDETGINGHDSYTRRVLLWGFCGDPPVSSRWFFNQIATTDKTENINFHRNRNDDSINEDWYTKDPSEFNQVRSYFLEPYKVGKIPNDIHKVSSSYETRYIDREQPYPTSRKYSFRSYQRVRSVKQGFEVLNRTKAGYFQVTDPDIVRGNFGKKPRSSLYKPPKTGTKIVVYKKKRFLTYHTGNGIIKLLTPEGARSYILKVFVEITEHKLLTNIYNPRDTSIQTSVGAELFNQVRNNHFDFESWSTQHHSLQTLDQSIRERRHRLYVYENLFSTRRERVWKIHQLIFTKIKHSNLIRRVQRLVRAYQHQEYTVDKSSYIIQRAWKAYNLRNIVSVQRYRLNLQDKVRIIFRAWRAYTLRSLGDRRTIIGLLSTKYSRILIKTSDEQRPTKRRKVI